MNKCKYCNTHMRSCWLIISNYLNHQKFRNDKCKMIFRQILISTGYSFKLYSKIFSILSIQVGQTFKISIVLIVLYRIRYHFSELFFLLKILLHRGYIYSMIEKFDMTLFFCNSIVSLTVFLLFNIKCVNWKYQII